MGRPALLAHRGSWSCVRKRPQAAAPTAPQQAQRSPAANPHHPARPSASALYATCLPRRSNRCVPRGGPCCAGEDVGHYGGSYKCTLGLYKKYGDMRVLDTPICGESTLRHQRLTFESPGSSSLARASVRLGALCAWARGALAASSAPAAVTPRKAAPTASGDGFWGRAVARGSGCATLRDVRAPCTAGPPASDGPAACSHAPPARPPRRFPCPSPLPAQ
jgi:hypothetical protein